MGVKDTNGTVAGPVMSRSREKWPRALWPLGPVHPTASLVQGGPLHLGLRARKTWDSPGSPLLPGLPRRPGGPRQGNKDRLVEKRSQWAWAQCFSCCPPPPSTAWGAACPPPSGWGVAATCGDRLSPAPAFPCWLHPPHLLAHSVIYLSVCLSIHSPFAIKKLLSGNS